MTEPEQCIICLEPLPRPLSVNGSAPGEASGTTAEDLVPRGPADDASHLDIVAALDGCEHINHDACIRSWAQKTNTCPICRIPFHTVRVYNGIDGTAVSTYDVQDRKQVVDIDAQQWLAQNPEPEDEESSRPCPVCNSAEREDILLLCDGCEAAYHTHCAGLEYVPQEDWYCMECVHLFELMGVPGASQAATRSPRPRTVRRGNSRDVRVRTRARLRTVRRQARNAEWQGAWGQFSGRFFEMSNLDLDNHDDDEDLEQYRLFQQHDQRELQRWQQRVNIAHRLGARAEFANGIPPQISERLQPPSQPVEETREERRAWGAFDRAREADPRNGSGGPRKRRTRSVTASPSDPVPEPERKLKRPRTRRLPNQGEASASAPSPAAPAPSATRPANGLSSRNGLNRAEHEPPLVSSLLKELEPHAPSEDETPGLVTNWQSLPEASSPALSPSPSNHSSPRALSLTPPPRPRETSPTLSLSTHIEPRYPPANYSPNRATNDHSDSETRRGRTEVRPLELRQPRPRRPRSTQPRAQEMSPTRVAMTHEEKKSINAIVKGALRPHWRAQKLTTEQYEAINRAISRKLYDEVQDASALDEETRQSWEKRATKEVAEAVAELRI